jgi:peptidoglycan/xylan/chitin deacetylase (PgdA/CDA1 family)
MMTLGQITGVPILDYHRIVPAGQFGASDDRGSVHQSAFRDQLQLIYDLKIATVAPEDVAASRLPANSVVLTFDDGYSSHYEIAFRELSEFKLTATFFVNTSSIGTGEFLDWTMAAEMLRGGMRFGSHAHNHIVLTTLNSQRVKEELRVSRQTLEQRLSSKIEVLAVPYGFCDQHVLDAAWESGYRVVCTSKPWPAQTGARVLSRVRVSQQTSLNEFRKLVTKDPAMYLRLWGRDRALAIPRYVFVRMKPELLGVRTAENRL